MDYIRICPVCETRNPPDRTRCACGASLAAVDFSPAETPAAPPVAEPAAPATATLLCPHADCGQPNPPGETRCLYCNRPLQAAADAAPPAEDAGRLSLPAALRADYRIVETFPATGSEADLVLVEAAGSGEKFVAKLYRKGIQPDSQLLARLAGNAGSHVVRLIDHGRSDGYAYELMEYCAHGTLRELLDAGPLTRDRLKRIVAELAAAIGELHGQRILHRDLKPENILVRRLEPLELALTDFGIASLQEGTQHFTGGARTVKYAAPEALTGVLDDKADWWSLGMIMLEAVSGRHPFDGLSEQVVNHHLATRPIDVRPVFDDAFRKLCRGLLLRDPKRRWGGAEVARWLADDPTLAEPAESEGATVAVRPYRLGKAEATSAAELAVALARHWHDGCKDLMRGAIGSWLENQLHDHNLARALQDILDLRGISDDFRLLRFLRVLSPDMPSIWRGLPINRETILAAARKAAAGDKHAQAWLDSAHDEPVLKFLSDAGQAELADIARRDDEAWTRFRELWNTLKQAEEDWRRSPKSMDGEESNAVVDFDDVMYSRPVRLNTPSHSSQRARLLLALSEPAFTAAQRAEVLAALPEIIEHCPWFAALGDVSRLDPVGVLVAHQMLPFARDDAAREKQRHAGFGSQREMNIASIRDRTIAQVRMLLAAGRRETFDRSDLHAAITQFHETRQWALGFGYTDESYQTLRKHLETLGNLTLAMQDALLEQEAIDEINAIWFKPQRIALGIALLGFCYSVVSPWLAVLLALAGAGAAAFRIKMSRQARDDFFAVFRVFSRQAAQLAQPAPS